MGWVSEDNEHEGWAAAVAPDGRLSGTSTGQGTLFQGITGRYPRDKYMPDYEVIPHAEIIGWRGSCECGWEGLLWKRVASSEEAKPSLRLAYAPLDGFADASQSVEDAIHDEWKAHVLPSSAVAGVKSAAREYNQAGRRLDQAVSAAKAAGASWADIGKAVGISRQSAHERWAERPGQP